MKYLILLTLLLSACTTAPTIQTVTQKVEVPIAISCKTETPKAPEYCFATLKGTDDTYTKVRCLLSDRLLSLGYELELNAALESCK